MTPFKRPQSDEINAPVDIIQNFERYKPGYPGLSKEKIEKGRANPTYLTLCRLAKALEMPAPLSQGLVAKDQAQARKTLATSR